MSGVTTKLAAPGMVPVSGKAGQQPALSVRIVVGAQYAYACIKHARGSMDVRLDHGIGAVTSLLRSAGEDRAKAERLLQRAALLEAAASQLRSSQSDGPPKQTLSRGDMATTQ